jgi:hypothetical protein
MLPDVALAQAAKGTQALNMNRASAVPFECAVGEGGSAARVEVGAASSVVAEFAVSEGWVAGGGEQGAAVA